MRDDLEPIWKALADPTRRRILDLLRDRPLIVREIADEFADEMTRYGVMKHLSVLREARLVTVRRVGRDLMTARMTRRDLPVTSRMNAIFFSVSWIFTPPQLGNLKLMIPLSNFLMVEIPRKCRLT